MPSPDSTSLSATSKTGISRQMTMEPKPDCGPSWSAKKLVYCRAPLRFMPGIQPLQPSAHGTTPLKPVHTDHAIVESLPGRCCLPSAYDEIQFNLKIRSALPCRINSVSSRLKSTPYFLATFGRSSKSSTHFLVNSKSVWFMAG